MGTINEIILNLQFSQATASSTNYLYFESCWRCCYWKAQQHLSLLEAISEAFTPPFY